MLTMSIIFLQREMITAIMRRKEGVMKSYSSNEVMILLKKDGWFEVTCKGDHHQFKHLTKKGRVTVRHPVKDLGINELKSIERQSGLKFK